MPAISPFFLNSTIYLYPSVEAANEGRGFGGCGFVVSVALPHGLPPYFYAVTNKHVIDSGTATNTVMRINLANGGSRAVATQLDAWTVSPTDDLAVLPFQDDPDFECAAIGDAMFATAEFKIGGWDIWPGDRAFFVGRFVSHDGQVRNKAVFRSGIISMLPDVNAPIRLRGGREQLAFLVEGLSLSGFSGSPTFVQLEDTRWPHPTDPKPEGRWIPHHIYFLGVDCGHLPHWSRVLEADKQTKRKPEEWTETNSGMAVVIPAWRLRALLDSPHLLKERAVWVERMLADRPKATDGAPDA